jgi:preprotein translocase subunit SecF
MEFFKIRRTIPFMRHALVFNVISAITFLLAVFFLATKGLNFSVEFTGGTLLEVNYKQSADVDGIRRQLESSGFKAEVQNFGSSRDVLIRMHLAKDQSSSDLSQKVVETLKQDARRGAAARQVRRTAGRRGIANYGAVALLLTAFAIVIYLWIRFEWRFGLSAIIANLRRGDHPRLLRLLPVGVLAGGAGRGARGARYSVNESVVVFDRCAELPQDAQGRAEVINSAITGVISHHHARLCTQIIVTTCCCSALTLYYFAVALTIGICFGIYSSVLVASPLLMWLGVERGNFTKGPPPGAAAAASTRRGRLSCLSLFQDLHQVRVVVGPGPPVLLVLRRHAARAHDLRGRERRAAFRHQYPVAPRA